MKVLMFGWEFPPHIAGGLGTACYGLTKGLAKHDVEVLFVMPSASGDEDESAVKIINASDISVADVWSKADISKLDNFLSKVSFFKVSSGLVPYIDPEMFSSMVESQEKQSRYEEYEQFKIHYGNQLPQTIRTQIQNTVDPASLQPGQR